MGEISVRPHRTDDRDWIARTVHEHWGSLMIVTRGRVHNVDKLPAFLAELEGERVGLLTYHIYGQECEVITMNALKRGLGIGTALLDSLKMEAKTKGCRGIWLITTNDNTAAMRFYQKKGFLFVAVHRDAVRQARRLKPEIPLIGEDGIPIRDEIELVMPL